MKKIFIAVFLLFCLFIVQSVHAQESERIRQYNADIVIQKDGAIAVTERIDYFFDTPRHGIYRTIPIIKTNADGKKYEMTLSHMSVASEKGDYYPFTQSRSGDDEVLKIGDPNTTLTGPHWYILSYTVAGALTYFPGHDELYWNVIGTAWQVPIDASAATVTLPESIAAADLNASCFVGVQGSTAKDCSITKTDGLIMVKVTRPLDAYEGTTVVVGFPKGVVGVLNPKEVVPFESTLAGKITITLVIIAGLFWYIVAPILVVRKWWKSGRDPKPPMREVSAWFSPPRTPRLRNLTPAETGTLVDETADLKDIYATLVDLARRGYMRIIEKKNGGLALSKAEGFDFEKVKDWKKDADIQPFEDTLLSGIFDEKDRVSLKDLDLSTTFFTVKRQIYDSLVAEGFFPEDPQKVRNKYYALAGVAFFSGNIGLFLVALIFGRIMPRKTEYGAGAAAVARSLKNFLVSQERQLKFQASKQMMFEKLLPYAIAFGVEEIWAKRFANLGLKQPSWYVSPTGSTFNTVVFAHSIGRAAAVSFASSIASKSSSGFSSGFSSGGGFSGGGGGGGGGGSW